MSIEAMKLALEAIQDLRGYRPDIDKAIDALRTAIQQAEAKQPGTHLPEDVVIGHVTLCKGSNISLLIEYAKRLNADVERLEAQQPTAQDEQEANGLQPIVAGAIFDFAGFMTTRSEVIEVGSTAEAGPVADLVKEWAESRDLDLADAAVLSWQLHITRASLPATPEPVVDVRCEGCGYMTHHREHMGCVRAAKQHTHQAPSVPADVVRDAERYRWLADCNNYEAGLELIIDPKLTAHTLGEKIDAAMLAAKQKGGA